MIYKLLGISIKYAVCIDQKSRERKSKESCSPYKSKYTKSRNCTNVCTFQWTVTSRGKCDANKCGVSGYAHLNYTCKRIVKLVFILIILNIL